MRGHLAAVLALVALAGAREPIPPPPRLSRDPEPGEPGPEPDPVPPTPDAPDHTASTWERVARLNNDQLRAGMPVRCHRCRRLGTNHPPTLDAARGVIVCDAR